MEQTMKKNLLLLTICIFIAITLSCDKTSQAKTIDNAYEKEMWNQNEATFKIANCGEPNSIDPAFVVDQSEKRIIFALFDGLVNYDAKTDSPSPGLAQTWRSNKAGNQWTFLLRKANWSDGTPITAHDVVYSWMRIISPETHSPNATILCDIIVGASDYNKGKTSKDSVGIHALDDYSFQIDTIEPIPYVIDVLTSPSLSIVPQQSIEKYGENWTTQKHIVSSGPFILNDQIDRLYLSCIKNNSYWDAANVKLKKVLFMTDPDLTEMYQKYQIGSIDWLPQIPTNYLPAVSKRKDFHANINMISYFYAFNLKNEGVEDPRVRQAISASIDRPYLAKNITGKGEIPAWGIVPTIKDYPIKQNSFFSTETAINSAQELISEAGYPQGKDFPLLTLIYLNTNQQNANIAEYVTNQINNNLGIEIHAIGKDKEAYTQALNTKDFDLIQTTCTGQYQDPTAFLSLFTPFYATNGYESQLFNNEMYKSYSKMDSKARFTTLRKAEDILISTDAAIFPLFYQASTAFIDTDTWGGFYPNVMEFYPLKDIYRKK